MVITMTITRKVVLLALLLASSLSLAQVLQIQNNGTTVGTMSTQYMKINFTAGCTPTFSSGAFQISCSSSGITLGSAGQVPLMNAGASAYAPVSLSQDCTITSAGVITCLKTNNVAFSGTATLAVTAYSALVSGTTNAIWTTPTGNGQCLMSGAASFATTQPTFQTCPSGFSNPMTTLGDVIYGGAAGAATRLAGPTATNGVPQYLQTIPAAGAAVAPTWAPSGVVPNPQTGTTYTVAATDRAAYLSFSNAASIAVTLPQAGTTGFASNFVFVSCDIGAGTATFTPTTSTISYTTGTAYTSAAATLPLTTGQCAWVYSDNTNYFAIVRSGGSSAPAYPVTVTGGTSGGIPYFSSTTVESASPILNTNILIKGGGAGNPPTNSLTTDDGTASTYTGTGGTKSPVFTSTGTTAGFSDYPQGTTSAAVAPCNVANSICEEAPAAVTSYRLDKPGAAPTIVSIKQTDTCGSAICTETFHPAPIVLRVTADFTDASSTALQAITGLGFTFPINSALNAKIDCDILYNQTVGAVADAWGVQDVTVAPTNVEATGVTQTAATTWSEQQLLTLATTTATNIGTFTPSAITTVWHARLHALVEHPSNASTSAFNIMVSQSTAADLMVIKRGSSCLVNFQ